MNTRVLCRPSRLIAVAALGVLSACSRNEQADADSPRAALTPAIKSQDAPTPSPDDVLSARLIAAGIPTAYDANFRDGQLTRIAEARTDADGPARGEYRFYGGRLLNYSGRTLNDDAVLELAFDLQGRITRARADEREATAEEISEIRSRAQLLRSHALAQHATRAHHTK